MLDKPFFCLTFIKIFIDTVRVTEINDAKVGDKVFFFIEHHIELIQSAKSDMNIREKFFNIIISVLTNQ